MFKKIIITIPLTLLMYSCTGDVKDKINKVKGPSPDPEEIIVLTEAFSVPSIIAGSELKSGTEIYLTEIKPPAGATRIKIYASDEETLLLDYDMANYNSLTGIPFTITPSMQNTNTDIYISALGNQRGESSKVKHTIVHKTEYVDRVIEADYGAGDSYWDQCMITNLGRAKCWGQNQYGQQGLGNSGNTLPNLPNSDSATFYNSGTETVVDIAISKEGIICYLLSDGSLRCYGGRSGTYDILGQGTQTVIGNDPSEAGILTPAINLGQPVTKIEVSDKAACALLQDGTIKCWGDNVAGVLGQENSTDIGDGAGEMAALNPIDLGTGRTVKDFDMGGYTVCAILDNDQLKCWGQGYYGGLGNGSQDSLGDNTSEMGDNLPYVDLGTGRTAKKIFVYERNTCAILDNDQLKCWGNNFRGQLGIETTENMGDDPSEMGDNLPYVNLGTGRTVKSFKIFTRTFCAILDNDQLKCWGEGDNGQLGYENTNHVGDNPGEMGDNLPAVNLGSDFGKVELLMVKSNRTCAVSEFKKMKCWGYNYINNLSGTSSENIGDEVGEMGDNLAYTTYLGEAFRPTKSFFIQNDTICLLDLYGALKCFGSGINDSLGLIYGNGTVGGVHDFGNDDYLIKPINFGL